MQVNTISTWNDWAQACGATGPMAVERIFDYLAIARIKRVYWRCFEGGLAIYPSKIAQLFDGNLLGNVSTLGDASRRMATLGDGGGMVSRHFMKWAKIEEFDPLACAVQVGRDRGIEVCAWFTIYEDDHGGDFGSTFLHDHPEIQNMDRDGRQYPGTVDFFYPHVLDYKLAIVDELLERNVDGILLDMARHNATPSGDENGVHRFGYNPEIRAAFRDQDGRDPLEIAPDDPQWLKFKSDYQSKLFREIRRRVGDHLRLDLMVPMPFDLYRWLCLDLPTLSQEGQIDLVMPFSVQYTVDPSDIRSDYESLHAQVCQGKAQAAAAAPAYWELIDAEQLEQAVAAAEDAGADQFLLYEADKLALNRRLTAVRAINVGVPRRRRSIEVPQLFSPPTDEDWSDVELHSGRFFAHRGTDALYVSEPTDFSVIAGPEALHLRLVAHGAQAESDPDFVREKKVFIDALGARLYWLKADQVHLFLDPGPSRRRYIHFVLGRNGKMLQETREDNRWRGSWQGQSLQVSPECWEAYITVPFRTLGRRPEAGERWGFNLAREQAATREAGLWFVTTAAQVEAEEWGDLTFQG